jgi:hypothetical protein
MERGERTMAETTTPPWTFDLPRPLVTVRQAAELLGLTPQRVNRLIAAGRLRVNRELGIKVLDRAEVERLRQARDAAGDEEPVRFTTRAHPVPALDLEAEILGREASSRYGPEHICPQIYTRIHQRLQHAAAEEPDDAATS